MLAYDVVWPQRPLEVTEWPIDKIVLRYRACGGVWRWAGHKDSFVWPDQGWRRAMGAEGTVRAATAFHGRSGRDVTRVIRELNGPGGDWGGHFPSPEAFKAVLTLGGGQDADTLTSLEIEYHPAYLDGTCGRIEDLWDTVDLRTS